MKHVFLVVTVVIVLLLAAWWLWFVPAGRPLAATTFPSTSPTTEASAILNPARPPRFFHFQYGADPKSPLREWEQINNTTWEESYHDGKTTNFRLVGPSDDHLGIILIRLPDKMMEIYVPLLNNPDKKLGWRYAQGKQPKDTAWDASWNTLGEMQDAE